MPEYSSTTITPADGVQVPSMNGSTSGNFALSALRSYILASKGQANGLAGLGADGKLDSSQIPDNLDDVLVYATRTNFPETGAAGKLYITADNNKMYRWDDTLSTPDYVELSVDLSDYATKAEVADAVEDLEAADTDLKNALQDSEQRIENLEQAVSGSLVQTNTDATQKNTKTITNANEILPWALLNRVGARAVAWNQLCPNGNFANTDYWTSRDDDPISISNNVLTVTASSGSLKGLAMNENPIKAVAGHKYLLMGYVNSSVAGTASIAFANYSGSHTISANQWTFVARVFEQSNSEDTQIYFLVMGNFSGGETLQYKNVMAFDLTTMQEVNTTADQFRAKFPASYYPNNAGNIINLNPSGFKVVGWNKWDEEWLNGYWNISNGQFVSENRFFGCKNLIKVTQGETYYFKFPVVMEMCGFDANGNFVQSLSSSIANTSLQIPMGVSFIAFSSKNANALTTYGNDICINISQTDTTKPLHNGVYKAYSETTLDTSFTSDYKYVNENCHDYSENVLVDGQKMREEHIVCGEISSADTSIWSGWIYEPTSQTFRLEYSDIKCGNNNVALAGYTVESYLKGSSAMGNMTIKLHDNNNIHRIYVKNTSYDNTTIEQFKASLGKIYYQKDAEVVNTTSDPIPNFPSEDGTTITAITPQTDLVNAIDVPTTIAYMTKISS